MRIPLIACHSRDALPTSRRSSRWLRFSLRSFLLAVGVIAVVLAVLTARARDQRATVAALERRGAWVHYDYIFNRPIGYGMPLPVHPLARLIGVDYCHSVVHVWLSTPSSATEVLPLLKKCRCLQLIILSWEDQPADAELIE